MRFISHTERHGEHVMMLWYEILCWAMCTFVHVDLLWIFMGCGDVFRITNQLHPFQNAPEAQLEWYFGLLLGECFSRVALFWLAVWLIGWPGHRYRSFKKQFLVIVIWDKKNVFKCTFLISFIFYVYFFLFYFFFCLNNILALNFLSYIFSFFFGWKCWNHIRNETNFNRCTDVYTFRSFLYYFVWSFFIHLAARIVS